MLFEEQLRLAREQAELHPDLEVSCEVERMRHDPESGTLRVEIANTGRTAATNVHGWIYLHRNFFGPPKPPGSRNQILLEAEAGSHRSWGKIFSHDAQPNEEGVYVAQIYENKQLVVNAVREFKVPLTLRRQTGKVRVGCQVVCSEGATFEDTLEVEVPERA